MEVERLNPEGLFSRPYYHQIVRSESRFLVHISGQVAVDSAGSRVGAGAFAAQVDAAFANLDVALQAAGVARADVVKVTSFVVAHDESKWSILKARHADFFGTANPAWTVLGVESLAVPGLLIEVEATAVTD